MPNPRARAAREFRRMMRWIVLIAVAMVAAGLVYSSMFTELTVHLVVAVVLGTFISVVLGTGLFALAFFSDKSGHDDHVTGATRRHDEDPPAG
jgi:hypothetical protein